jgi:hypothetical protein
MFPLLSGRLTRQHIARFQHQINQSSYSKQDLSGFSLWSEPRPTMAQTIITFIVISAKAEISLPIVKGRMRYAPTPVTTRQELQLLTYAY